MGALSAAIVGAAGWMAGRPAGAPSAQTPLLASEAAAATVGKVAAALGSAATLFEQHRLRHSPYHSI